MGIKYKEYYADDFTFNRLLKTPNDELDNSTALNEIEHSIARQSIEELLELESIDLEKTFHKKRKLIKVKVKFILKMINKNLKMTTKKNNHYLMNQDNKEYIVSDSYNDQNGQRKIY